MDAPQADSTLRIVHGGRDRIEGTSLAVGDVLEGKYRLEGVIGAGGMGIVVLATHLLLKEQVAIKFLLDSARERPVSVARFEREARAAATLRSAHVAKVIDVGRIEGIGPYTVMEYLDGSDLEKVVEGGRALAHDLAVTYILQACDAIGEAHRRGIIHRDLKPQNLFLAKRRNTRDGGQPIVKVLDFGISKMRLDTDDRSLTRTNEVIGSPLYMSPEQLRGGKDVDERGDIWGLGAILYRLIGKREPFDGETLAQLCSRVLMEEPPDIRTLCPTIPDGLAKVIERCLEKDASARPQNIPALVQQLTPFAMPGARTSMTLQGYQIPTNKGGGVRFVAFVALLGLVGGGVWYWQRQVPSAPTTSATSTSSPPSSAVATEPSSVSTTSASATSAAMTTPPSTVVPSASAPSPSATTSSSVRAPAPRPPSPQRKTLPHRPPEQPPNPADDDAPDLRK